MSLNKYFDNIYVLNLNHRTSRLNQISERLQRYDIKFEKYNATDGYTMKKIWQKFDNNYFSTPNYLACAVSHLSIYNDAQLKGYDKILILEDDVVINKNINLLLESSGLPDWNDVLYLGWIPLSDDTTMWTYAKANNFISQRIVVANNFWGMFAYGTTRNLRHELLEIYLESFPMELDRYLVLNYQPSGRCLAYTPQLFACQDIWSDNMNLHQSGMLNRSVDRRFANLEDYF